MSAHGAMIYQAYLKRALRIAAREYARDALDNPHPTDVAIEKKVTTWVQQAHDECRAEKHRREVLSGAKERPGAKPASGIFSRRLQLTEDEAITYDKMLEDAVTSQDGEERDEAEAEY